MRQKIGRTLRALINTESFEDWFPGFVVALAFITIFVPYSPFIIVPILFCIPKIGIINYIISVNVTLVFEWLFAFSTCEMSGYVFFNIVTIFMLFFVRFFSNLCNFKGKTFLKLKYEFMEEYAREKQEDSGAKS